ncbi:Bromodomain-containing protein [Carex littledalei]|uniref:Bromodomain-containing protein n=1 Tax=Carex littledalei TaxID=544730 RepID=A0A833QLN7_9POAL|nr:Bromodomain-containing protein [Carex littledalei]
METETEMAWGTWEELVLGGAVLRHGAAAWNAVAAELRSRTRLAHLFSPQECEAKFAQLQKRYSGSETWFEELRKQRVDELKRELEKSENSIGSLQSKLATLSSSGADTTSRTEVNGRDIISSSCKECQSNSDSVCNSKKCEDNRWHWGVQKKRGRRERKRERESIMDSEANSSSHTEKQGSTEVGVTDSGGASVKSEDENVTRVDLELIFKTILENKECSVFQKRLESQKKNRYKRMIRRHVDLQIVSSKLSKGLISSPKELLRDLLLLANNALVFYPKNSPEHNSAIILRNLSSKTLKKILSSSLDTNSSPNEEVEPEKPQIKEDLVRVKEENKELDKEPSKNKELDKEPCKNKELDKEPRKNKELDKEPRKNKELDKEPRKSKELDKEPRKSKELDKEPRKNKELHKDPSKIKKMDKEVPRKPLTNTRSGNFIKKKIVDRPVRGGGGQRGATNRGRKRARR